MARGLIVALMLMALPAQAAPVRVVSLDACADALVLSMLPRTRIAALSNEATLPSALEPAAAKGIRQVKPDLESIVALRPDLVVRGYGGGAGLAARLQTLGIKVVQLDGSESLAAAYANIAAVAHAAALPLPAEARRLQHGFPPAPQRAVQVLYLTPSGFTAGKDSFIDEMIRASGAHNLAARMGISGFAELDAEKLLRLKPDLIVMGFADFAKHRQGHWALGRHPVMQQMLARTPMVQWPSRWLGCTGVQSLQAVARLRETVTALP